MLADIAIAMGNKMESIFSYRIPENMQISLGKKVIVPFGRGKAEGFVICLREDDHAMDYKEIIACDSAESILTEETIRIAQFISEQYLCPLYNVLQYMLPKLAKNVLVEKYHYVKDTNSGLLDDISLQVLSEIKKKDITIKELEYRFGQDVKKSLDSLIDHELIEKIHTNKKKMIATDYRYYALIQKEDLEKDEIKRSLKRAKKQEELLRYLVFEGEQEGKYLRQYWPDYITLAEKLVKKGFIGRRKVEYAEKNFQQSVFNDNRVLMLNDEQQYAFDKISVAIDEGRFEQFLLYGITGSGKTEIYLQLMKKTLAQGKSVLYLVPEIALTPQLIGRLSQMLGTTIEVLHSSLSDSARYTAWENLKKGHSRVLLGVRSSVLAPMKDLGLIIVDEEHESTFKQSEPDPRYHAVEVAKYRAGLNRCPIVLGSATPSVESYYSAMNGEYTLLKLTKRAVAKKMPQIEIVDLAKEFKAGNRSMFSISLAKAIEETILRNEQVILFMNRRGYASTVLCRECGEVVVCPKCGIPMTYHKERDLLKCHYCEQVREMPKKCPACGSGFIRTFGSGTEQVVAEIHRRWPFIKTLRLDLDSTKGQNAHQKILESFAKGEAQILVGTQMVTKGLDFANVTLVGIMLADQILNLPDYRAAEHTFQLLTQCAGRAGRGEKEGNVIIQTYNPEHYSIVSTANYDGELFYQKELYQRELLHYPPFAYISRVLFSSTDQDEASKGAEVCYQRLKSYPEIEILGPSVAPIEKIRNRYRYQMILVSDDITVLKEAAQVAKEGAYFLKKNNNLRITVDMNPINIL